MNHFVIIYLTLIWLQFHVSPILSFSVLDQKQLNQKNRFSHFSTSVVCNKNSLIADVIFQEPFLGIIYAKRFPLECRSYGNGSKVVHFETKSHECGVKAIQNHSNKNEYELVLYVQNDPNIEQVTDEKVQVKCAPQDSAQDSAQDSPQDSLLTVPTSKFNGKSLFGSSHIQVHQMLSHNFTLSHISDSLECRMDVMRGRMPFLKPIDGFVDLGQDVTILIKIKEIDGIDSMLSRCYAHDGSHSTKQELTNKDGCAIDSNILPNFNKMHNSVSESKVYYTTFPAFKFPDKTNLNIQCTLIICNTTCPQIQCDNTTLSSPQLHRIKRLSNSGADNPSIITMKKLTSTNNNDSNSYDLVLSEIGISNSLGVKNGDSINKKDQNGIQQNGIQNTSTVEKIFTNELVSCLSSQIILTVGLLMTIALLGILTLLFYYGIKAKQLNQKLSANKQTNDSHKPFPYCPPPHHIQSFSYGRMLHLTD